MDTLVDLSGVTLETERLRLRPWREDDAADFYAYARVDGVGQMAGWRPHRSQEESLAILQLFIEERKTLALELKETGHAIGSIGLEPCSDELDISFALLRGRELGYALSRDYWGRGLVPEAVRKMTAFCFQTLNCDFLSCGCFNWNNQSRRVIEKCGFTYYKSIDYKTRMGTVEPSRLYVLYRE